MMTAMVMPVTPVRPPVNTTRASCTEPRTVASVLPSTPRIMAAKCRNTKAASRVGEEIGTAPPVTTSRHFSSYSAPYYIKDGPHVDRFHHVPGESPARLSDATGRPEESS